MKDPWLVVQARACDVHVDERFKEESYCDFAGRRHYLPSSLVNERAVFMKELRYNGTDPSIDTERLRYTASELTGTTHYFTASDGDPHRTQRRG